MFGLQKATSKKRRNKLLFVSRGKKLKRKTCFGHGTKLIGFICWICSRLGVERIVAQPTFALFNKKHKQANGKEALVGKIKKNQLETFSK